MSGGRDPTRQLLRALARSAAAAGCTVELAPESLTPWASATFVGGRHRVAVTGAGLEHWLADLPEAELALCGCYLASCEVEATATGAVLTLLVLAS